MLLQDVITLAQQGELKSISAGNPNNIGMVVGYINLGLIELYKRFPVRTKEYLPEITTGTTDYTMPDDYMWLTEAYGEVPDGNNTIIAQLPINESEEPYSVFTPSFDTVQIPYADSQLSVALIYVPSPKMLTEQDMETKVPIPMQLLEALLHYIGYRAHGAMNGDIKTENNTHYMRFEASCKRVQQLGMFTPDGTTTINRLITRGFV